MPIQSQDMYQLLIGEYKEQQARLKQIMQKLHSQSASLDFKIKKQLQNLDSTSQTIIKNAANLIKTYVESLQQDIQSANIINISTLSTYLKQQKSNLSNIISQSSQTTQILKQSQKSGKEILHSLSKRKKVEKYFEYLQCFQLEKQIEYLQKNIFVGKSSSVKNNTSTIIYDNVQSVTVKQEQQLRQKMKILLQELERVVGLSNECDLQIDDDNLDKRLIKLNKQSQRLLKVQNMVDNETKQIVMVKDFFNNQNPTQAIDFIEHKMQQLECNEILNENLLINAVQQMPQLKNEEIGFILSLQHDSIENVKVYKKPFDEINDILTSCKAKLKKVRI